MSVEKGTLGGQFAFSPLHAEPSIPGPRAEGITKISFHFPPPDFVALLTSGAEPWLPLSSAVAKARFTLVRSYLLFSINYERSVPPQALGQPQGNSQPEAEQKSPEPPRLQSEWIVDGTGGWASPFPALQPVSMLGVCSFVGHPGCFCMPALGSRWAPVRGGPCTRIPLTPLS